MRFSHYPRRCAAARAGGRAGRRTPRDRPRTRRHRLAQPRRHLRLPVRATCAGVRRFRVPALFVRVCATCAVRVGRTVPGAGGGEEVRARCAIVLLVRACATRPLGRCALPERVRAPCAGARYPGRVRAVRAGARCSGERVSFARVYADASGLAPASGCVRSDREIGWRVSRCSRRSSPWGRSSRSCDHRNNCASCPQRVACRRRRQGARWSDL